jgi:hypothetical protein
LSLQTSNLHITHLWKTSTRQVHDDTTLPIPPAQNAKPNGVISLRDDLKHAFDCDIQAVQIAVKAQAASGREEIATIVVKINPEELEIPAKKPSILIPPKEADVKQIDLGTGDPSKTATINAHISAK